MFDALFDGVKFVCTLQFAAGVVTGAALGWKTVSWYAAKAVAEAKKLGA